MPKSNFQHHLYVLSDFLQGNPNLVTNSQVRGQYFGEIYNLFTYKLFITTIFSYFWPKTCVFVSFIVFWQNVKKNLKSWLRVNIFGIVKGQQMYFEGALIIFQRCFQFWLTCISFLQHFKIGYDISQARPCQNIINLW